jgi:hypothetical protein
MPRSLPDSITGSWLMPSALSVAMTSRTLSVGLALTTFDDFPDSRSRTVPSPASSSRKPFSRIQSSLKIFDRYLLPASQSSTRIFAGRSICRAYLMAPITAAPPEPPAKIPSSRARSRVIRKHSLSSTRTISSMSFRFIVDGKKSSPIPSTLYVNGFVIRPLLTKS